MIKKLLCWILGHSFGSFDFTEYKIHPEYFYCKRCKSKLHVSEGWS